MTKEGHHGVGAKVGVKDDTPVLPEERYADFRSFYELQKQLSQLEEFDQPPDYDEVAWYYAESLKREVDPSELKQRGSRNFLDRAALLNHPLMQNLRDFIVNKERFAHDKFRFESSANRALRYDSALDLKLIDSLIGIESLKQLRWQIAEKLRRDGNSEIDELLNTQSKQTQIARDFLADPLISELLDLERKGRISSVELSQAMMDYAETQAWFSWWDLFAAKPLDPTDPAKFLQREDFARELVEDLAAAKGVKVAELHRP